MNNIYKIIIGIAIAMSVINTAMALENVITSRIEGNGTHFEINNSQYLNVTLDSSETIKLTLESVTEMVVMHIEPISDTNSTQITISGFNPETIYHKYEDDYHNHTNFTTDTNGNYTYIQDISIRHLVFIQPRASTKFIKDDATGGDCTSIGTWDQLWKTCSLTSDLTETVQIDSDGITLYGNGHAIVGGNTGAGIYIPDKYNVQVLGVAIIRGFTFGIYLASGGPNILQYNHFIDNNYGIFLADSYGNLLRENGAFGNDYGIILENSHGNNIFLNRFEGNTLNNAFDNTDLDSDNLWDDCIEGNYYSDYIGTDSNNDGIGELPYPIPGGNSIDKRPAMNIYDGMPRIRITSPKCGESWQVGMAHDILWRFSGEPSNAKIELIKGGILDQVIKDSIPIIPITNNYYTWNIPLYQNAGNDYQIKISTVNAAYITENFKIFKPTINVVVPNGGENWAIGTTQTIKWSNTGNIGSNIKIELLKGGIVNHVITSSTPISPGFYEWTIPSYLIAGNDYQIRITSTTNGVYTDTSDGHFVSTAALLHVKGTVKYSEISTNNIKPFKYAKVEIDNDQDPKNGILRSGNTMADGSFDIQINDISTNTIYVRTYTDSDGNYIDKVRVNKFNNIDAYYFTMEGPKSSYFYITLDSVEANIYADLFTSYDYFKDKAGLENIGKITVNWENIENGGRYDPVAGRIMINYGYYYAREDRHIVLYHEYGHFVMDSYSAVLKGLVDTHGKLEPNIGAWSEGWATFASAVTYGDETIRKTFKFEGNDPIFNNQLIPGHLDLENAKQYFDFTGPVPIDFDNSDKDYGRNAAFLWDVYDGKGGWIIENKDQFDGQNNVNTILDIFKSDKIYKTRYKDDTNQEKIYEHKTPLSAREFYDGWVSMNKPQINELTSLAKYHFDEWKNPKANSPVNIHLYDVYGQHVGLNKETNNIDREIVGSYYSGPDSHPEEIFLLSGEGVDLKVDGTGDGTFTLTYESANNGITSNAIYENIPVTSNSVGYILDKLNIGNRILRMDNDGNGIIDKIILPTSMEISGEDLYNITFLPPITTMQTFNLSNGSTLPIKFTARNSSTNEFIYDDSVNVTIINSTGYLIAKFTNGTGTNNVRINPIEEQYTVNLHTKDYNLKIGETYAVIVTFGDASKLKGYNVIYFVLVEGGKAKGKD